MDLDMDGMGGNNTSGTGVCSAAFSRPRMTLKDRTLHMAVPAGVHYFSNVVASGFAPQSALVRWRSNQLDLLVYTNTPIPGTQDRFQTVFYQTDEEAGVMNFLGYGNSARGIYAVRNGVVESAIPSLTTPYSDGPGFFDGSGQLVRRGTNLIFAIAEKLFPRPWSLIAIVVVMLSTVLLFFLQFGFVAAVVSYLACRPAGPAPFGELFMQCLGIGLRKAPGVVLIFILRGIPVFVATLFFIIPGVFLSLLFWSSFSPYRREQAVVVDRGIDLNRPV